VHIIRSQWITFREDTDTVFTRKEPVTLKSVSPSQSLPKDAREIPSLQIWN